MARILIVEDEEKIARFVTLELEHEGYQVEHAADGRTAVDLALERDYDLILLDVLLPQPAAWRCCGAYASTRMCR